MKAGHILERAVPSPFVWTLPSATNRAVCIQADGAYSEQLLTHIIFPPTPKKMLSNDSKIVENIVGVITAFSAQNGLKTGLLKFSFKDIKLGTLHAPYAKICMRSRGDSSSVGHRVLQG
jgi:hypothetical protein